MQCKAKVAGSLVLIAIWPLHCVFSKEVDMEWLNNTAKVDGLFLGH